MKNIKTDSRTLKKGDFFWPLKGENFNGHNFIKKAILKGCSGFVYAEPLSPEILTLAKQKNVSALKVNDTLKALGQEAKKIKQKFNPFVIAITGSNGKTTTKEIIGQILASKYPTVYPKKSFNNLIGLPLTLLNIDKNTKYVVLEMGMNHPNEITQLMKIATPNLGVLINILNTHIGNFDSFDDIVAAKGEIAQNLEPDTTLILNEDCLQYPFFHQEFSCQLKTFGTKKENLCTLKAVQQINEKLHIDILIKNQTYQFIYPGLGLHNAQNVTAAVACLYELGLSPEEIQEKILKVKPPHMRLQKILLSNGATIINDSYNANPTATKAAIETLTAIPCSGQKYFIFGDMAELGKYSQESHQEIGDYLSKSSIDNIYTYGEETKYTYQALQNSAKKSQHFENKSNLATYLKQKIKKNDLILFKGSNKLALWTIIDDLKKEL
jgi:UDP-N-acetylmuramoyl-tripeptide--D-alanyl-D-alanine ligase